MTNNLSLYIHIPFCIKKCDYCAFYSLPNQDDGIKQDYFEALKRQIGFFEPDRKISSVYFGGGTPPLIGLDRLCSLVEYIKSRFELVDGCEITVEINPKSIGFDGLTKLYSVGVNRLSIGVQSADNRVLKSIGRIHTFEDAKKTVFDARRAGFKNVSADLIFALPQQTNGEFYDSLRRFLELDVNHISAYSLQLEEGTPLFCRSGALVFPSEDEEEAQYAMICSLLKERGFNQYEVSAFCKAGFESLHNLNYWLMGEYFGFGAAAHSFYNKRRFSAEKDIMRFIATSGDSLFAPTDYDSADILTEQELEEERIMLGLRTKYGAKIHENAAATAQEIANLGYGSFENRILILNSRGFRVSNSIIAKILL